MNPIDIGLLFILVVGFIWGFSKGFIYMIFSLIAIAAGLFIASKAAPAICSALFPARYQQTGGIIVFIILFTLVYFIIRKLSYLFENMIEFLELEWMDSLLGGVLGFLQIFLIAGIILSYVYSLNLLKLVPGSQDSRLAGFMMDSSRQIVAVITGNIGRISRTVSLKSPL